MLTPRVSAFLIVFAMTLWGGGVAWAGCGSSSEGCGENEVCCEHRMATFCEGNGCASVHKEGQCVAKERGCGEFWCGNRQCQNGWLFSKNVCCVYYQGESSPEYSCAVSELSCPGNTAQLSIRPTKTHGDLPEGG
jgi:hypothetical protein